MELWSCQKKMIENSRPKWEICWSVMSKNCPVFLLNQLKWLFGHLVSKHQIYISNRIKYTQLPTSTRLNVSISQAVLFQKYFSHFFVITFCDLFIIFFPSINVASIAYKWITRGQLIRFYAYDTEIWSCYELLAVILSLCWDISVYRIGEEKFWPD